MPMPEMPDPNNGLNLSSAIIAVVIGAWGGIIAFLQRMKEGKTKFNWLEFSIDISTSMFAGFVAWGLATWLAVPEWGAGAFAGLGGHAGTRTFFMIRSIISERAKIPGDE